MHVCDEGKTRNGLSLSAQAQHFPACPRVPLHPTNATTLVQSVHGALRADLLRVRQKNKSGAREHTQTHVCYKYTTRDEDLLRVHRMLGLWAVFSLMLMTICLRSV